ncbi:MAG: ATP-dependent DNA helicase RecG [Candidatus Portnoybacteria bacterium RIFCSPLOWO2_12_FULL_39_9]|uniref:ATP-dependent DNA helicase RecG n=1 Tax=Candidatus Portnoybacteria bacterium RIFCSPHIGHO2_12_FULL_38_9 TaxID=1801997 RepID=A0A1G2FGY7_9BACT|nr:MAG: ATP-dependent DNA helicase RecG [Candidatus Portnoybacteria bacterium RIFCSPHIGHO2_12_FULL_38_9]OGZ39928.1 MAG: ATP-dependent DNA helicase RecG [Candidatus Portnoybacteria bacterium RIFCSPLOWO2_12_FULL_39_9]
MSLNSPIEHLKKVGPSYLKILHKVGIKTVKDLLFYFPHRYDDFSQIVPISQLRVGQTATISGKISDIKNIRTWKKRMYVTEALIEDKSGSIKAVWFNQPYLIQTLQKGRLINLSGKATFAGQSLCLSNPAYETLKTMRGSPSWRGAAPHTHTGRLVPIYHETYGLSSRYLRYLIKPLLPLTAQILDFLPVQIKQKFGLIDLNQAIRQIHFPDNLESARKARSRLSFDELFLTQLTILKQRQDLSKEKAPAIAFHQKLIQLFVKRLPFKLTDDQRLAAWQIFQDLAKPKPMNRLLNGDVGSGKTIVATMAALETAKAGYQAAFMAPTEVLAKQHFETLKNLLKNYNLKIALLTSSESRRNGGSPREMGAAPVSTLKKQIADGEIDIIIGTHALIQEGLTFNKLGLAIVDEQHRFGVVQRAALQKKIYQMEDGLTTIPHLLSMTATPIPRTLALTIYGDLDISLLKEMPKGRQKIITKVAAPALRKKTYDFIRTQVKKGRQGFVICPLIEESEKLEVKSVTEEYKKLSSKIFPDLKIAMLHGQMKSKEKEEIMKKFKEKKSNILVSTSVVEVGVDVPNATIMIIEGAERFGLAQLHQFRGRVGRSEQQSYCFLFTDSTAKKTHQRLKALLKSENGFELAEKDLKIRGPGDLIGSRQWGLPDLAMASLNDLELIQKARQAAKEILGKNLLFPALQEKLKAFQTKVHFE